jgi:RNA polymerase sigma factor (sigma-70 family)
MELLRVSREIPSVEAHGRNRGKDDEREAFVSAYEVHAEGLYKFCLRQVGYPTAEDISQKVFERAWVRWSEVDSASRPIGPWLYGVARNVVRNQRRRRQRQEETVRDIASLHRFYADDPSEELARREAAHTLVGSLEALPDKQRDVVTLCLLSDCSYETAATVLEVPVGTVRSRLYRARLNLALAVRATDGS